MAVRLAQFIHYSLCLIVGLLAASNDECYMNKNGFLCCDKDLESTMKSAMFSMDDDLLGAADRIQKGAEEKLGGKFEIVVGFDDFAYRTHYNDGKTCKVEADGIYALAWRP